MLTSLWPVTLDPDRFDTVAHEFGPLFLMLLPVLLVMRPPKRVVAMVAFGLAFFTLCMTQRQSMRFVLAAVGPWSIGVAWVAHRLVQTPRWPARICLGCLAVVLAYQCTAAVARTRHFAPIALGCESPESYLARREPTYVVGRWIGDHLPGSARIVGQDHRGFYFPRPYNMELAHRRRTGLGRAGESAEKVRAKLIEAGFTHVLFCPPQAGSSIEFDPALSGLLDPWTATQQPLYNRALTDADGVMRQYAIYDLSNTSTRVATREGRP